MSPIEVFGYLLVFGLLVFAGAVVLTLVYFFARYLWSKL